MVFLRHSNKPSERQRDPPRVPCAPSTHTHDKAQEESNSGHDTIHRAGAPVATANESSPQGKLCAAASLPACPLLTVQGPVTPDMALARQSIARVKAQEEDVRIGAMYLTNLLKHPEDPKYRTLKKSNRKFYTEVWLNSGMRGLFLALGFRHGENGVVSMGLPGRDALECIEIALKELTGERGRG
ncbi:unnamed protein product [Discosporangium mesarthrocarpum]